MPHETDPDKLGKMSRRRMLSTLSALGVSAASLPFMTDDVLAEHVDDLSEEVPYVARYEFTNKEEMANFEAPPQREPVYDTVPRSIWNRMKATENATKKLRNILEDRVEGSDGISTGYSTEQRRNGKEKVLKVFHTTTISAEGVKSAPDVSKEKLEAVLPSSITGAVESNESTFSLDVPVVIEERTCEKQSYYDYEYDPIPAGCQMYSGEETTLCSPAWKEAKDDGEYEGYVYVTAAHCLENNSVHQPDPTRKIGETLDKLNYSDTFDAGIFTMENIPATWDVAADQDNQTEDWPINGTLTWEDIKIMEDYGEGLWKQGRVTGREIGSVNNIIDNGSSIIEKAFETAAENAGGDSGGPHFQLISEETHLAGVHFMGSPYATPHEPARATPWEFVEDYFNLNYKL